MSQNAFLEGEIPFKIAERDEPCKTYYKIYGDLRGKAAPLIVLHGGPGAGHEYVEPYKNVWAQYGIPVVFYDQIGCAASTHLLEKDKSFWQPSLFVAELQNLLYYLHIGEDNGPGFHLLGHSWGAILAIAFVVSHQPSGLRKLMLGGANADGQLFKKNLWDLKKGFPKIHSDAINEAIQLNDFTTPAYLKAMSFFANTYMCHAHPSPPELLESEKHMAEDPTVSVAMHGRSVWLYNGSLEYYSSIPLLPKINVPTLVYNGEFDTARDNMMQLFVDYIPNVRWVKFPGASHVMHLDSPELLDKVLKLVVEFMQQSEVVAI